MPDAWLLTFRLQWFPSYKLFLCLETHKNKIGKGKSSPYQRIICSTFIVVMPPLPALYRFCQIANTHQMYCIQYGEYKISWGCLFTGESILYAQHNIKTIATLAEQNKKKPFSIPSSPHSLILSLLFFF